MGRTIGSAPPGGWSFLASHRQRKAENQQQTADDCKEADYGHFRRTHIAEEESTVFDVARSIMDEDRAADVAKRFKELKKEAPAHAV